MLPPITIRYPIRPARRSLDANRVADLFGLSPEQPPHVVAENLALDIRPGDVALFTGPSGSGKSSLLRAAGAHLNAIDALALTLPDVPLVEALPGSLEDRLAVLAGCGLSEARLLLRTPSELSDGQRYRFRIAWAFAHLGTRMSECGSKSEENSSDPHSAFRVPSFFLDEFAAYLDRPLAKVLAHTVTKLAKRAGVGVLAATTHDDFIDEMNPDVHVRCLGDGVVEVVRRGSKRRRPFDGELWLSDGTKSDWPHFARWHYRSHHLGFVKRVILLWHRAEPIGICVFATPAASLTLRSKFFGLTNPRSEVGLAALNRNLWLLQRVVLHPTYRGAGIAAAFVRRACALCPVPWIETLSAMGHANPFFERAGFVRVGVIRKTKGGRAAYTRGTVSAETAAKSRYSEPVYYVFDNRRGGAGEFGQTARPLT